jgi:DNA replicative helicase MCM subunit Mcm2 (Cdc46/Mcm family)
MVSSVVSNMPLNDIFQSQSDIVEAIALEISGMSDFKEVIACQLFSNIRKKFLDAMKICSKINGFLFGHSSIEKSKSFKIAYCIVWSKFA